MPYTCLKMLPFFSLQVIRDLEDLIMVADMDKIFLELLVEGSTKTMDHTDMAAVMTMVIIAVMVEVVMMPTFGITVKIIMVVVMVTRRVLMTIREIQCKSAARWMRLVDSGGG